MFNYVRRGLFERDKLTVATMLTLKVLANDGLLAQEEVDYLVMSKVCIPDLGVPNILIAYYSVFRNQCLRNIDSTHSTYTWYTGVFGSRKHGPSRRMAPGGDLAAAEVPRTY